TFVSDGWGTEYMHLFHTGAFHGTLRDCDEGELEWLDKKALLTMPDLWEGDRIFLRLMDDCVPFFSLRLRYEGDRLTDAVLNGKQISTDPVL
ncbi:MAG: DNA mismatch repair protein MutT, partial [Oscillospiraceae bacterium]|nr:DNA mismatch repair protein MutT [Oscillospiraceae bacterium]